MLDLDVAARSLMMFALLLGAPAAALAAQNPAADSAVAACLQQDTATAWQRVGAAWDDESSKGWSNDSLRQQLLSLAAADQAVRQGAALADSMRDTAFVRRMAARDSLDAAALRAIIARFGWPRKSLVGARGAHAAFLIAQHNASLQHEALARMRRLPAGEVSPSDLALLEDRVLVSEGKPQRYGTQLRLSSDGRRMVFPPIEDVEHLDARRAAVGLPPIPVYLCVMRTLYGRDVADPRVP